MRRIPLQYILLAVLSAGLQAVPFPIAGPVPLWLRAVCWICLVPLLWALSGRQRTGAPLGIAQSGLIGYVCGIAWYLANCYWIYPTMHLYGGLSQAASTGVLILFSLYLGLYMALFGILFATLRRRWSLTVALSTSPIMWVAVEFARARVTGFPWDLLGYAQIDNLTMDRLAPWTGVFGLSLVIAIVNMFWAMPAARLRRVYTVTVLCCAAVISTAMLLMQAKAPAPAAASAGATAVLLQENLSVGAGMQRGSETKAAMMSSFAGLSRHPDFPSSTIAAVAPQLIAWPESPAEFIDSDPAYREFMETLARTSSAPVLSDDLAFAGRNSDGGYNLYNSASFFRQDGSYGGRYDKIHLVPFGEYVPYKPLFFFTGHLLDGLPFIPGTQRVLFEDRGRKFGVFICYESIFGDEIRQFVRNGAQVLVNLSDDGWYGDTSAPWEHLDMVRMRAIENDRWVLRSTNTGVTASIDPYGRVVDQMPRHVRGALLARFDFISAETFYTRHGDWIAWICVACTLALLAANPMWMRRATASQ